MVGPAADDALVRELTETIATVPPSLVAWRLKTVLDLDMSKDFARSTVPTLYLRGTDDRLVTERSWRLMKALRDMPVVLVPGPHLLLQANPIGAWRAIQAFIDSLPAL